MQDKYDIEYANEQIRRSRHPVRRLIKRFYLNHILKDVIGSTLDLGCGAGQLLARLPGNSLGIEVNPVLAEYLTSLNMNILHCNIIEDSFLLPNIPDNKFQTLVLSHVVEHFSDAANAIRNIFASANRIGISRIIIVVPGKIGYEADNTHRTFVDALFLEKNNLKNVSGYELDSKSYFPFPFESFGNYFVYQELKLVYNKKPW